MSPVEHLIRFGRLYPEAWKQYDELRAKRKALGDWPAWCFCPLAGAYAIVSGGGENRVHPSRIDHVAALGALSAWRVTKGVYEYSQALEAELWATPVTGDLPSELLLHLPEWAPYVMLQDPRKDLVGFWVHLEHDAQDLRTELRFLLDFGDELHPVPLHVDGKVSVEEALDRALRYGEFQAGRISTFTSQGIEVDREAEAGFLKQWLPGCLSLTLYLCQRNLDLRPLNSSAVKAGEPGFPEPVKTRHGPRLYPPDAPRRWEAGWRIGPALEAAQAREREDRGGEHAGPRPHIRRAHWHTYRVGQGRTKTELKWLHPILVGGVDETVPTVREVL